MQRMVVPAVRTNTEARSNIWNHALRRLGNRYDGNSNTSGWLCPGRIVRLKIQAIASAAVTPMA